MYKKLFTVGSVASMLASSQLLASAERVDCDVGVIGGGAAGANAAVFLKDKGYSVCLFERRTRLGGHCHTQTFQAPAGEVNWLDNGVMLWQNVSLLESIGIGNYNLKADHHIQRFISAENIIRTDFGSNDGAGNSYVVDLANQLGPLPAQAPTQAGLYAFYTAFNTLYAKVAQYPWLEQAGQFPDPLPAEMLMPFSDFITQYNLQPLIVPFFHSQIVGGGLGSLERMTTLYALLNLRRGILALAQPLKAGIKLVGGCSKFYDSIAQYLSTEQVYYNAEILSVNRPESSSNNGVIHISANINGDVASFKVNKLIVAIPQTLNNLAFMDLDSTETAAFSMVKTRVYSTSVVQLQGPVAQLGTPLSFKNLNVYNANKMPNSPAVVMMSRWANSGPVAAYLISDDAVNRTQILAIYQEQLAKLPQSLVTGFTVQRIMPHDFQPHFSAEDLARNPSPYTTVSSLQGRRNTFHIGSLFSFAESVKNWEFAFNLIQNHF